MLRKILFWMHLVTGVSAGLVVLMMSVTGVMLTYEMQLNQWARRDYRAAMPASGNAPLGTRGPLSPLSVDALIDSVANVEPELAPSSVTFRSDPLEPAVLSLGRGNNLYVDRYTGEVLGDGNGKMKRFMRNVMYWHRWFAMSGDERAIGRAITGASNLGFLFLVSSGFYLWWPRHWNLTSLRRVTWFRSGLSGKARNFNWHNVIGFWMAIPLVVIVASGVMISYRWAGDLVYTLTGSAPPVRGASNVSEHEVAKPPLPQGVQPASLHELYGHAVAEIPQWRSVTMTLPDSDRDPVKISVDVSVGRQPARRTELVFDRSTCELIARRGFSDQSKGRQIRSWLRFAHTGEVYGLVGQTIAGATSAGAAVLVWTGLALAWRRWRPLK